MNPVTSQTGGDERLLLLAMALDTRSGLTFDEIAERGLLGDPTRLEPESMRRTMLRYREQLEEMGVRVVEVDYGSGARFKVDARYTYAQARDIDLSQDEALTLVTLLTLYLEDAQAPYVQDVRRARDKIAAIAGLSPAGGAGKALEPGITKTYNALLKAYTDGCTARFEYTNAHGVTEAKAAQVYGLFERAGHTYAVALDTAAQAVKVFRCDRIDPCSLKVDARASYRVPADFCVDDYIRLPFQYGSEPQFEATFTLAEGANPNACKTLTQGKGTWRQDPADTPRATWTVDATDLEALARWSAAALRAGLVPTAPRKLVSAVADGLRKAASVNG